jgi:cell wall hydrolase, sleB
LKKLLAILLALPSIGFAKEIKCLSEMAYYEARGEGTHGIKAVTDVMFNRMRSSEFPDGVCANFKKHKQYSTAKMAGGRKDKELYKKISEQVESEYAKYRLGDWQDSTSGSLYFNSNGSRPSNKVKFKGKRGRHFLYG